MARLLPLESYCGKKFNRWTVLSKNFCKLGSGRHSELVCECECGSIAILIAHNLVKGYSKSCGCLKNELLSERRLIHGRSYSPEYLIWRAMKSRCLNPNVVGYVNYGGRGIGISPEWIESFEVFFRDMGPRPSEDHSIERVNNSLGYSKENCIWATRFVQARNKSSNKLITIRGETKPLCVWVESSVVSYSCVQNRLKMGWNPELALTKPSRKLSS
jgi:hypothetical protein